MKNKPSYDNAKLRVKKGVEKKNKKINFSTIFAIAPRLVLPIIVMYNNSVDKKGGDVMNSIKKEYKGISKLDDVKKDLVGVFMTGTNHGAGTNDHKMVLSMYKALGIPKHKIDIVYGENESSYKSYLDSLFTNLSLKLKKNDKIIFFYVGHGSVNSKDESFLSVTDNLSNDGILDEDYFFEKFSKISAEKVIVMEACRSGGLCDKLSGLPNTTVMTGTDSKGFLSLSPSGKSKSFTNGFCSAVILDPSINIKDAFDKAKKYINSNAITSSLSNPGIKFKGKNPKNNTLK